MSFPTFGERDISDGKFCEGGDKVFSVLFVEGKPFDVEVVFDPGF